MYKKGEKSSSINIFVKSLWESNIAKLPAMIQSTYPTEEQLTCTQYAIIKSIQQSTNV